MLAVTTRTMKLSLDFTVVPRQRWIVGLLVAASVVQIANLPHFWQVCNRTTMQILFDGPHNYCIIGAAGL